MTLKQAVAATIIIVTVAVTAFYLAHPLFTRNTATEVGYFSLERARLFLESQLVPEAGLLRAAVNVEPDRHRVYIASDNLLASRALQALDSPLGRKITEKLVAEHSHGFNGRHEALFGEDIPDKFYGHTNIKIGEIYSAKFNTYFEILFEKPDTSIVLNDWTDYADLLAYRALEHLFQGRFDEARRLLRNLLEKWDGHGFRDKAYIVDGKYESYKVALALYLSEAFKKSTKASPVDEKLIQTWRKLLAMMQREDGGVVTHYIVENGKPKPIGDANTETTSITVLAFAAHKVSTR